MCNMHIDGASIYRRRIMVKYFNSFLCGCHLTRTRRAHQVSAVTLAKLQEDAFLSTGKPDTEDARETWRQDMISRSPTVLGHYPAL